MKLKPMKPFKAWAVVDATGYFVAVRMSKDAAYQMKRSWEHEILDFGHHFREAGLAGVSVGKLYVRRVVIAPA